MTKKIDLLDLFCLQANYEGQKSWCEENKPEDVPQLEKEIQLLELTIDEHLKRDEPPSP